LIVTLTVNPAIDHTVSADRLVFDDRAYILARGEAAGGRGINASSVIHSFGGKTLAISTAGGKAGEKFKSLLGRYSFPVQFVPIQAEIRINLTITDKHGLSVKLNEAGPAVTEDELAKVEATVKSRLPKAEWLMLCGSLPPSVPPDFYARLIEMAQQQGVMTLLDADGDSLLVGLEAKPTVVCPNQQEAERLLNRALLTRGHFLEAAEKIVQMGAQSVVLSLGARGAIGVLGDRVWEAIPPRVDVLSPIGAGDALAAAFVWARKKKKEFWEALRWGVAAGTASAKLPGVTLADLEQTKEVYKQVEVRPVK
jgi:1-phosphofructokinase family hexose kinase